MNTLVLLCIILVFCIFTLRNKIIHPEKFVYSLKENESNKLPHSIQEKKPSRLVTLPGDYLNLLVLIGYFVLLLPNTKKES